MYFEPAGRVRLVLPRSALTAIFDECDRYEQDETGGRVIGTYSDRDGQLIIQVKGTIGPGSRAHRSPTSFFQDGEEQEEIFRQIEQRHPDIEHLGNWHTHHVNGLSTLSGGDVTTYRRIVNHNQHNTSFFYALLVVAKNRKGKLHERYLVKHYLLRRKDDRVYEINPGCVEVTDTPLVSAETPQTKNSVVVPAGVPKSMAKPERIFDRDIVEEFYRDIRPYSSPRLGVYWRGRVELIDTSHVEVIVLESTTASQTTYSVTLRDPPMSLKGTAEALTQREFRSARAALITAERVCNRVLYEQHRLAKAEDKAAAVLPQSPETEKEIPDDETETRTAARNEST